MPWSDARYGHSDLYWTDQGFSPRGSNRRSTYSGYSYKKNGARGSRRGMRGAKWVPYKKWVKRRGQWVKRQRVGGRRRRRS